LLAGLVNPSFPSRSVPLILLSETLQIQQQSHLFLPALTTRSLPVSTPRSTRIHSFFDFRFSILPIS
jgi:hypothetical protein